MAEQLVVLGDTPNPGDVPLARSPIPAPPGAAGTVAGWRVDTSESTGQLTLAERSPLAKVLVRADEGGATAGRLGVERGRAARDGEGTLVVGSGPGEWTLLAAPGRAGDLVARWDAPAEDDSLVSAVDLTSARVLLRLTGERAPALLAKVCAIDLDDGVTPNGTAFRSSVAKVTTDVVRDDTHSHSYLLSADSSYGGYLHEALLDAGAEFGITPCGFPKEASR